MQTCCLDAALEYARLGYRVIPLKPGTKVPDLRHWPEEASNDPDVVAAHFQASRARVSGLWIEPNVGIVTGHGLAVLDIDTNHGGARPAWAVDTLTVRTPSGGLHLYYSVDALVPNSVGRIAPGVDVRGERGQVAAPPSVILLGPDGHPNHVGSWSGNYELIADRPIQALDANLLIPADERQDYLGRPARRFEYRDEVPVGQRNNYLTSLAGYLFAQGESRADVLIDITREADGLGFTPRDGELASIARSVSRYH